MKARTTLPDEFFDQPYTPPTKEDRARWIKKDANFQTKSGYVPHQVRPTVHGSEGVLITWKLVEGIGNLRTEEMRHVLEECFRKGKDRFGFQLIGYSILRNHLHMIATVPSDEALCKGAQGLGIRIGKAINKFFGRKGRVLRDRYHAKPLFSRAAIRHAIIYVLQNARKHGIHIPGGGWDIFSSGRFAGRGVLTSRQEWPVAEACYLNNGAWTALRGMRPGVFPGHLQLRA